MLGLLCSRAWSRTLCWGSAWHKAPLGAADGVSALTGLLQPPWDPTGTFPRTQPLGGLLLPELPAPVLPLRAAAPPKYQTAQH